jgi:hypothetical protein
MEAREALESCEENLVGDSIGTKMPMRIRTLWGIGQEAVWVMFWQNPKNMFYLCPESL